jgi:hypothetical protein
MGRESCSGTPSSFPELSLETALSHVARSGEFRESSMLVGYARVSTREQNPGPTHEISAISAQGLVSGEKLGRQGKRMRSAGSARGRRERYDGSRMASGYALKVGKLARPSPIAVGFLPLA